MQSQYIVKLQDNMLFYYELDMWTDKRMLLSTGALNTSTYFAVLLSLLLSYHLHTE